MVRPQSEELNRSGNTPLDPDSIGGVLEARDRPKADDRSGATVPPGNRPGQHPDVEQDQPDLDDFVARFSGDDDGQKDTSRATRVLDIATKAASVGARFSAAVASSAWRVARGTAHAIRAEVDARRDNPGNDEKESDDAIRHQQH